MKPQQVALGPIPEAFVIPDEVIYLNCANLSLQLKTVRQAGLDAIGARARPWELAPEDWFSGAETLRSLVARTLDASPNSIALVPSVSYGIAVAAANVDVRPGQSIVLLEEQFPSNVYAWKRLAAGIDAEVRFVSRPAGAGRDRDRDWTDAVLDAIDEHTAVVSVPNCHWIDGALLDLERIRERAHDVEAALVVDASQSLGAYPLSTDAVRPDFLVSVGYKWLLGPYGLSFLYVGPRYRDSGRPIEESWLTRAGSSDFSTLVDYTDTYRPGARRFDMGEFPQFGSIPQSIAAFEQILEWGVERIHAALSLLTQRVSQGAVAFGGVTLEQEQRVGHMIGIRLPGGLPDGLRRALSDQSVYISIRGDCMRVSPHLHTSASDIDRFLEVVSGAARRPGP